MGLKKVLIPLPSYGFDPTEVAIPWEILCNNRIEVVFITPNGEKAQTDTLMLTGKNLGVWSSTLKARKDAVEAYLKMEITPSFCHPLKYDDVKSNDFNALLLPGGHDKGVIEYLESAKLQSLVVDFFIDNKPVGAICHGVVLAARSIHPKTNNSVIYNYKTTALLKKQELLAYNLTRLWLKDYYLTYPGLTVEDEVTSVLSDKNNFIKGPLPLNRDSKEHLNRGFVVKDRNFLSARWPGDAYNFSYEFVKMITNQSLK